MKSRTKLLIEWLKKLICAADETYGDVADEALIFLDSLPAFENDLRNGGYIQDRNGRPVKNGDKIKKEVEDGTLKMATRTDKATGKEQAIRIEASSGLSKEEIERMKAEAEANAENDKKEREKAEKLNMADSLIFQTETQLSELGDKLPADKKPAIEEALEKLKSAHKEQNLEEIDSAMEALNKAFQEASAEMYANAQAAEAAQPVFRDHQNGSYIQ